MVLDNVQWFEVPEGKHATIQGKSMPALELMGLGRLAKRYGKNVVNGPTEKAAVSRFAGDRSINLVAR
ncbi:hypothetical protein L1049_001776 [Liquidambar formosana]|uniref:Uncharacterized protein n=1 Tax=Liquidambar formosana TaxID=63359 RepID=A0AAP0QY21_LIQFO